MNYQSLQATVLAIARSYNTAKNETERALYQEILDKLVQNCKNYQTCLSILKSKTGRILYVQCFDYSELQGKTNGEKVKTYFNESLIMD